MIRGFPRSSPGPKWEAIQEPEPSSDDELDTEDGEVDTLPQSSPTQTRLNAKRDGDSRVKTTQDPPQSASPVASTSTNVVGDTSRSQLKRKEFESLFTSKKRVRYVQDQDNAMDLDLDEHDKIEGNMVINGESALVQKIMGRLSGRQSRASLPVSSKTMDRSDNSSTSPSASTRAKPDLPGRKSGMKSPPRKRLSESAVAERSQPATRDLPSKLAGLPFDAYKSKTVPSSPGRSMVPSSPLDKLVDKDNTPLKRRIPLEASQPTRHPSTQKTKVIPPDAEIIEISEDDDDPPPPSISKAKSNSIAPSSSKILGASEQARQRSGSARKTVASSSVPSPVAKKFLPKVPIEVIEISDSDEEQLLSKAQLQQQKNVGISSGSRLSEPVQECATGSNAPRGQSLHLSSSNRSSFEGGDGMNVDEARDVLQRASPLPTVGSVHSIASDSDSCPDDHFDIPASPRASSELNDYTSDNQAARGLIPLPSSSPSSIGLSPPKDSYLSTAPAPMTTTSSLAKLSLSQQSSTSTTNVGKPTIISFGDGASASASTSRPSNRLGFSPVPVPSSLQAPPPAKRHSIQLARKTAIRQAISDEDEDSDSPSVRARARRTVNKGKEKEIRQPSPSSSGAESIHMRSLRDALAMDLDKPVKQHFVSPFPPTTGGQTLAEAITSAGQLNRAKKKMRRHVRGTTKDVPIDLTSDVEGSVKLGSTVDENDKALKAAIGSSRLLVNLLPTLKAKISASTSITTAAAVKMTEHIASSSQEREPLLSPSRTQDLQSAVEPPGSPLTKTGRSFFPLSTPSPERKVMVHDVPSQKPSPSLRGEAKLNLGPTGLSGGTGESDGDVSMADVSSRNSISPTLANVIATSPSAATVMTPSIPFPLTPSQPALGNNPASTSAKPFNRLTPPKRSSLAMTESSFAASTSSQQKPSPSDVGRSSGSTLKSHLPKRANVQPVLLNGSNDVRTQSPPKQPSPAAVDAQPLVAAAVASQSTTINHSSGGEGNGVASPSLETASFRPQPTAAHGSSFGSLGVPSDDSRDDEEKECQALLEISSDDMDIVSSHGVQPSLRDSIAVRDKAQKNSDASVASSASTTFSAATGGIVSPLGPEIAPRRSSRRSSGSSNSGGLGTAFDDDFGPFDAVPATRTPTPEDQEPPISTSPDSFKTYGGIRALTWKNFRKDLNNFTPKVHYAKDLPHALQDHINSMSEYTQMLEGMRNLFQATILENTVEDEPDAPPIEVWNNVDTQPTPPWEFFYTNHMWLGEGVPPPDIKSLVSCNCKGGCNPKSKTCACLLRQREAVGDPQLEFAYDKNGKLKIPGYPIFECNDLCGCSDECRNRVVQHGRKVSVNIGKTEMKGWGVFAGSRKIPEGTYIGIYSGELLTDAVAHERGVKYNKFGRTYLFDIDFHHLREPGDHNWESSFTVDAYHAGNFSRFLNHSCDPNCRLYACYINEGNIQKPLLVIFSRRDIEPYEEICFNYQGLYPGNDDDSDDSDDDEPEIVDPDNEKDIIYCPCRCGAKNCTGKMFK